MIDAIKKTLLAGVGAAVITKEKVEASLGDLVAQGKVSTEEARTLAERIVQDGRAEFESVSAQLDRKLNSLIVASAGPAQAKLRSLEDRLRRLEAGARAKSTRPTARKKPARSRAKRRSA